MEFILFPNGESKKRRGEEKMLFMTQITFHDDAIKVKRWVAEAQTVECDFFLAFNVRAREATLLSVLKT